MRELSDYTRLFDGQREPDGELSEGRVKLGPGGEIITKPGLSIDDYQRAIEQPAPMSLGRVGYDAPPGPKRPQSDEKAIPNIGDEIEIDGRTWIVKRIKSIRRTGR